MKKHLIRMTFYSMGIGEVAYSLQTIECFPGNACFSPEQNTATFADFVNNELRETYLICRCSRLATTIENVQRKATWNCASY
jgi:hypothetical protein